MGREVRRVPQDWQHPKDNGGHYAPLHGGSASLDQAKWDEGAAQWARGFRDDWKGGWKALDGGEGAATFAEWYGDRPVASDYMPDWPASERTHWQMYESTTEGTPISPVMDSPESLARWLADNGASAFGSSTASYESWLATCQSGYSVGLVHNGTDLVSGVEHNGRTSERAS
jgi:hypothetical protein